jgi:riboflavin biosynthesis pyrimidine reductase
MESARLVAEKIRHIWRDPLTRPARLLHVMAVASRVDGSLGAMRITPQTPSSATDRFSLEIARARADIILTSGAILRSEPDLQHAIAPPAAAWRQEVLRKTDPPEVIFLSRGQGIPFDHPALRQPGATLATGSATPDGFMDEIHRRGIRHRTLPGNSPRALVDQLLSEKIRTITLECGPSTAAQFYRGRIRVDELMLSWCQGFELPDSLNAGAVESQAQLRHHFGPPRSEYTADDSSYRWRFSRWVAPRAFDS